MLVGIVMVGIVTNAKLLSAPRASAAPQLNNLDAFERLKRGDVEQERIWIIGLLHQGSNPRKIPMQSSLFTPQRIKLVNFSLFCLRHILKLSVKALDMI